MLTVSYTEQHTDIHRYFPEWAERPVEDGIPVEADRNSYSAAGYAEEFGYRTQQGLPLPAPTLDGDPESSGQWRYQTGALHPGYPECATPVNHDRTVGRVHEETLRLIVRTDATAVASTAVAYRSEELKIVRVGDHRHDGGISFALPERVGRLWRALRFGRRL
jgi:hypothetical protein